MAVTVTEFSDLGVFDDLGIAPWHWVVAAATGGISLAWDKQARNEVGKGVKAAGKAMAPAAKVVGGILGKTACPLAKQLKDGKTGGSVVQVGAAVVGAVCPKVPPKVQPPAWYETPWKVGALAAGAGVLLGALFSVGR